MREKKDQVPLPAQYGKYCKNNGTAVPQGTEIIIPGYMLAGSMSKQPATVTTGGRKSHRTQAHLAQKSPHSKSKKKGGFLTSLWTNWYPRKNKEATLVIVQ